MLDKLRAMGEYIKNNNVGDDIKQRFSNVLQKYKDQVGGGIKSGIDVMVTPHQKVVDTIKKYIPNRPSHDQLVKERDQANRDLNDHYQKDPNKDTEGPDLEQMQNDYKQKALSNF